LAYRDDGRVSRSKMITRTFVLLLRFSWGGSDREGNVCAKNMRGKVTRK